MSINEKGEKGDVLVNNEELQENTLQDETGSQKITMRQSLDINKPNLQSLRKEQYESRQSCWESWDDVHPVNKIIYITTSGCCLLLIGLLVYSFLIKG
jgi:hypothetical protein